MKKTFIVTFKVDGRYRTIVEADVASDDMSQITEEELDKIKELAEKEFEEADFGELECIDCYPRMVEDYDTGSIVWDRE